MARSSGGRHCSRANVYPKTITTPAPFLHTAPLITIPLIVTSIALFYALPLPSPVVIHVRQRPSLFLSALCELLDCTSPPPCPSSLLVRPVSRVPALVRAPLFHVPPAAALSRENAIGNPFGAAAWGSSRYMNVRCSALDSPSERLAAPGVARRREAAPGLAT